MQNKNILLLKNLLLSTSQRNKYKYCRDKKKQKKIIGGYIGVGILYLMLMAYCIAVCIGFGEYGFIKAAPGMCAMVISMLALVFTFFKTNGYLFNFKEYDMLMSLPFKPATVASCKFLYMYLKSLPWYVSIAVPMMVGYGIYAEPEIYIYPVWLIMALFLPLIPMLVSTFIGFLIAKVSSGFRKKNIIQTVLTFVFVIFCFAIRFFMEDIFRNGKVGTTMESLAEATDNTASFYLPVGWFSDAVNDKNVIEALLLVGVSSILFAGLFYIVGGSYRKINSNMKSHAASKSFKMTGQKKTHILNAIAFKEWKRMTGSSLYMTNGAMGDVMAIIMGIAALILGHDKLSELVVKILPDGVSALQPAIPFIVYFFVGMFSTTVASPSLEGKNYWIVQSLPIEKRKLYQGKMLFNMYLTVPIMEFVVLALCIVTRTPVINTILYLIFGFLLCCFSTAWGCVCGLKHMKLEWENEIEVIKQGAGTVIYLLPNMFAGMILMVLSVFIGMNIDHNILTLIYILIIGLLASLSYRKVMVLSKK